MAGVLLAGRAAGEETGPARHASAAHCCWVASAQERMEEGAVWFAPHLQKPGAHYTSWVQQFSGTELPEREALITALSYS